MSIAVSRLLDMVGRRSDESEFVLGLFLRAFYCNLVDLLVVGDGVEVEDERAGHCEADDTRISHQLKKPRGTRKGSTVVY